MAVSFFSSLLLMFGVTSGIGAGWLLARLAPAELRPAQRWLLLGKKLTYLSIVVISVAFLAHTTWVVPAAFFGLVCGYFKKIFFSPWLYTFFAFLFFLSIRSQTFLLVLSVALFLHLLLDGISSKNN